jgi:peroxiredoxin
LAAPTIIPQPTENAHDRPKTLADFSASATGGKPFKLSDFAGHPVVLYFYPSTLPAAPPRASNFTPIRREAGAVIAGISRDSFESHGVSRRDAISELISMPMKSYARRSR